MKIKSWSLFRRKYAKFVYTLKYDILPDNTTPHLQLNFVIEYIIWSYNFYSDYHAFESVKKCNRNLVNMHTVKFCMATWKKSFFFEMGKAQRFVISKRER